MTGMTASITINGDVTDHLLQQQPSAHTHTHTHTHICMQREGRDNKRDERKRFAQYDEGREM